MSTKLKRADRVGPALRKGSESMSPAGRVTIFGSFGSVKGVPRYKDKIRHCMHRFFPASVLPLAVWRASRFARQEIAPTLRIILGCSLMVTPCVTGYGAESTLAEITALMDRSLEPIPVNHAPGPEYSAEVLNYAMARGLEQTHGGRLWAAWVAGGDNDRAFIVAAISDDHGFTWRHPAFVIQSIDSDDTPLRRRPRVILSDIKDCG